MICEETHRLTITLPLDEAPPSWNNPNNQDGFLSLDRSEAQNLDFTPSELIYPFKLKRLRFQVLLEVLPKRLAFRTPYFNSVFKLLSIIQQLKLLLDKDSMSKLYIHCQINLAITLYPLVETQGLYG